MTQNSDYYRVLGVLPSADHVVIVAAYRALASRFHPDRWKGDPEEATEKMAAINVAFGVVGDPEKRKTYDSSRASSRQQFDDEEDSSEDAFVSAIKDYEDRWQVACEIYPDLVDIRANLSKTAIRLAFAFVILMIVGKQFKQRKEIASAMERKFLETYFGSNETIIDYARNLIQYGFRDAVVKLNRLVDVIGDDVDPEKIINRIESQFELDKRRASLNQGREQSWRATQLKRLVMENPFTDATFQYARALGYVLETKKGGLFKPDMYVIRKFEGGPVLFEVDGKSAMCIWIKNHLIEY